MNNELQYKGTVDSTALPLNPEGEASLESNQHIVSQNPEFTLVEASLILTCNNRVNWIPLYQTHLARLGDLT